MYQVDYINWNPGEPNDLGGEDCVEMYVDLDPDVVGKWNDAYCEVENYYICKADGKIPFA